MEVMNENTGDEKTTDFFNDLLDDLMATSDEDLRAEAIEDHSSIAAAVRGIRDEIDGAINSLAKDRLVAARDGLAQAKKAAPGNRVSPETRRRIAEFLSSDSMKIGMTLAARKDQGASERDILSAFADLCELHESTHRVPRPNFGSLPKAEYILRDLGVTSPEEIDVEAIAWRLGAQVKYERLDHCEARIVGADDAAIITVNKKASAERQRFSICHEIGHWIYHRRQILLCQADEIERPSAETNNFERVADRFASELLMPAYLFKPIAESLGRPSMQIVRRLSAIFNTSQTATAIRLVEMSQEPMILTCYGNGGRRWFTRSQAVKKSWFPNAALGVETSAFNMLYRNTPQTMPPRSANAATWFGRSDASRFELAEESVRVAPSEVLTLLRFKDASAFLHYSEQT
jgi:Zn-dependent peptidase ImmA (M78 family)